MNTYKLKTARGMFNVRDSGNSDGFPLVMIHGWPESSYTWEPVARFINKEFRIIAPDLRGLGDSERTPEPECYRKRELAADMLEVVDALEIGDFFLVGHDWGGCVVQEMCFAVPDRIKKLVIMNFPVLANGKGNDEAERSIRDRGSVVLMYQYFQQQVGLPEAMIRGREDAWIRWCFSRSRVPEESIREFIRCYRIENTPFTGACYYRMMKKDRIRRQELNGRKLSMPTLYLYGNKDQVIIPAYLAHIEECFERLEIRQLELGHFLHEEEPETVGGILNEFLAGPAVPAA